jgi:hypothetical protein
MKHGQQNIKFILNYLHFGKCGKHPLLAANIYMF